MAIGKTLKTAAKKTAKALKPAKLKRTASSAMKSAAKAVKPGMRKVGKTLGVTASKTKKKSTTKKRTTTKKASSR